MRIPLLLLLLSPAFCLGEGESVALLMASSGNAGGVEERRAEAMGKRLDQFETMAGRVYREVQITKIDDGGISFSHADGAARLRFEDLSPEQRRHFGINREDAAAVYAREMRAREAYERRVEESEKARHELAEKQAAERAEAHRFAMEKAAERRAAVAAVAQSTETIPLHPTIKRVDSGLRYSSGSSRAFYYAGYGYPVRYSYGPSFRFRGGGCRPAFGSGIHFSVR